LYLKVFDESSDETDDLKCVEELYWNSFFIFTKQFIRGRKYSDWNLILYAWL